MKGIFCFLDYTCKGLCNYQFLHYNNDPGNPSSIINNELNKNNSLLLYSRNRL